MQVKEVIRHDCSPSSPLLLDRLPPPPPSALPLLAAASFFSFSSWVSLFLLWLLLQLLNANKVFLLRFQMYEIRTIFKLFLCSPSVGVSFFIFLALTSTGLSSSSASSTSSIFLFLAAVGSVESPDGSYNLTSLIKGNKQQRGYKSTLNMFSVSEK